MACAVEHCVRTAPVKATQEAPRLEVGLGFHLVEKISTEGSGRHRA